MRSRHLAPAALAATIVAAAAPALAAEEHEIVASDEVFSPAELPIRPGDRVVFRNAGGYHNFVFEDGPRYPTEVTAAGDPAWGAPLSRTFTEEGAYRYYCDAHGAPGGVGMSGVIVVSATPAPPPGPTPTPTTTPTPSPGPVAPPRAEEPLRVRTLAAAAPSFCARRSAACRRPGVRLRIDLSRAARVTGVLRRGRPGRRFGRVDFGVVRPGPRTLRFRRTASGRRLERGRYALAVTIDGAGGRTVRFRVR